MNLVFLGPPGSGKGTQSKILAKKLNLFHISTGDILREEIKKRSKIGKEVQNFIRNGELVPDELILEVIKKRIKKTKNQNGFVFDGFPRTVSQAENLDTLLSDLNQKIDKVIKLSVSDEEVLNRLGKRLICPNCGVDFNTFTKPPKISNVCDFCNAFLEIREDDKGEVVLNRLKVYKKETAPVEAYYRKQKKLKEVNAERKPDEVFASIRSMVQ
jgi:adenylate kinase